MNKNKILYENKEYIILIVIIFLILIFILKIDKNHGGKYEEIWIEKSKNNEKLKELIQKVDKRYRELEKIELELLELKNKEQEKFSNKFLEIKKEMGEKKYIKILNDTRVNKNIKENEEIRVINTQENDTKRNKFANIKNIDLSKIKSYRLVWPVESRAVIKKFGDKITTLSNKEEYSRGIKIEVKNGERVNSGVKGIVTFSGEKGSYGYLVEIEREDGLKVRYSNLKKIEVVKNEIVFIGDKIGEVVENGMLNYEVLIEGIPVDPLKFKYD